jgi:hypothetical protein
MPDEAVRITLNGAVMMNGRRYVGADVPSSSALHIANGSKITVMIDPASADKAEAFIGDNKIADLRIEQELAQHACLAAASLRVTEAQMDRMLKSLPFEGKVIALQAYLDSADV